LTVGGGVYAKYFGEEKGPEYDFVKVERGDLKQTVDATGIVRSADHINLHFELGGTVENIVVKEGDIVKVGDLLTNLRLAELNASVSQAQANLNQKLAGSTKEDIRYYESAVDVADADLEKTKADKENAISVAESGVSTAKNNLNLAVGGENSQIVQDTYNDAVALSFSSLTVLDNGLTQADNILGINNSLANDEFEDYLSTLNSSLLSKAKSDYLTAKLERDKVKTKVLGLNTVSLHEDIDNALLDLESSLSSMSNLLTSVSAVLSATPPVGDLSQSELDALKTTIETSRSSVATQYTNIINQAQSISTSKNSYLTYAIAYEKSLDDLENAKLQYDSLIKVKEAAYKQAQANLDKIKAGPREVDVAYYRAALQQSQASRSKAMIYAPIDGVVTKIHKKVGELAMASEIMVEVLSPHFEIEVDIPETDIVKLALSDKVVVTLDAYGDEREFMGNVVLIDPASTNIQDVVYYKVKVAIDNDEKDIRSGMTANVLISTETKENVLYLPFRSILTHNGFDKRYIRVVENGELKEKDVTVGLRGDDGLIEVETGVEEGQEVVLKIIEE